MKVLEIMVPAVQYLQCSFLLFKGILCLELLAKDAKSQTHAKHMHEVSTVKSLLKEPSQDTIPTVRLQVFFRFDL